MTPVSRAILWLFPTAVLSVLPITPSFANHDTTYFSIEHSAFSVANSHAGNAEFEPTGVRLKVGTRLSYAFDIEAHVAATSDDSTPMFDQFNARLTGVYLKGYLPLGSRSALYGLGGYSWTKFIAITDDEEYIDRQSGFSYGFGVETRLSKNIDLSADFMNYSQQNEQYNEVASVSFGVKVYF